MAKTEKWQKKAVNEHVKKLLLHVKTLIAGIKMIKSKNRDMHDGKKLWWKKVQK